MKQGRVTHNFIVCRRDNSYCLGEVSPIIPNRSMRGEYWYAVAWHTGGVAATEPCSHEGITCRSSTEQLLYPGGIRFNCSWCSVFEAVSWLHWFQSKGICESIQQPNQGMVLTLLRRSPCIGCNVYMNKV